MRDLLNLLDTVLTESVGLANRKPGTLFANPQEDQLTFQGLEFYPEGGGAYDTPEEFQEALTQVCQQLGIDSGKIRWTNSPQKGGFGIAQFDDVNSQRYYLGRYFQKISPIRAENKFPNELPGGFKLQTNVAKKEAAGYKPTDVLTSNLNDLTVEGVLQGIQSHFGAGSDEARAAEIFISTNSYPIRIPLGNMNFTAFTNYFCEMLQPVALVQNKKTTGEAQQAANQFLTKGGYTTCTITFGGSKIGGLTDSTLTNPAGQTMGLSSKAEGGAKASAGNLKDKIKDMTEDTENTDGQQVLKKYTKEIELINTVTEGSTPGSLNTAVLAKIITPEERDQIMAIRKLPPGSEVVGKKLLSPALEKRYLSRKAKDSAAVIPFFHIRAVIANEVADWVNKNTNFGKAAAEILNWGAFIQVETYADLKGDEIVMKPFHVIYPSLAVTNVELSADKTFYSTGSKGNFTFKILYNGATEITEPDEVEVDTAPAAVSTQDLDAKGQQRSGVTAAAGGVEKPKQLGNKTPLGRPRQR